MLMLDHTTPATTSPFQRFAFYLPSISPGGSILVLKLDLQIKSLESEVLTALAMLRRQINPHESSVYRLHPELLSLMASHLATDDLIKATHVSYHWRSVLLSDPSLWTTLDFAHIERALTFLTRSKSASIFVSLQRIPSNTPLPLELLGQSAERITRLYVDDYASQKELLLRSVSSLRTLEFYPDDSDELNETTRLTFPSLKTLFVGDIDPFLFSVPHLTHFGLSSDWCHGKQAIDGLLDFLRDCPLLEELEVRHSNKLYTRRNHNVVHLPNLRAYTHHTTTDFHLGLYNMLSYPPSCSMTFSSEDRSYGLTGTPRPFQNPTFLMEVRRVKLKAGSMDYEDYVEGTAEVIDTAQRRVRSTRRVILGEAEWERAFIDVINPLYPCFLKALDRRSIDMLCVEELAVWFHERSDRVEEVLGHLEHIRTLILSDSAVGPYLRALAPMEAMHVGGWRCLGLDTLVIYNLGSLDDAGDNVLSTLRRLARRRKEAGIPLKSVSLFLHWTPPPEQLGWMKDLEELRGCIGMFEFVNDADALLDWNVDEYFLKGLDHLRRVQD